MIEFNKVAKKLEKKCLRARHDEGRLCEGVKERKYIMKWEVCDKIHGVHKREIGGAEY